MTTTSLSSRFSINTGADDRAQRTCELRRYAFIALAAGCVLTILIVVQGIFLLSVINRADVAHKDACEYYGRIASLTISSGMTPQLADIIRDARIAYQERKCHG